MRDYAYYIRQVQALLDMGNLTVGEYAFLTLVGEKLDRHRQISEDEWRKLDEVIEQRGR